MMYHNHVAVTSAFRILNVSKQILCHCTHSVDHTFVNVRCVMKFLSSRLRTKEFQLGANHSGYRVTDTVCYR